MLAVTVSSSTRMRSLSLLYLRIEFSGSIVETFHANAEDLRGSIVFQGISWINVRSPRSRDVSGKSATQNQEE